MPAAISSFDAFASCRSPSLVTSVTALSGASKPMPGIGHVVVDDQIEVLVCEHPPLPLQAGLAHFGAEPDQHLPVSLLLAEQARARPRWARAPASRHPRSSHACPRSAWPGGSPRLPPPSRLRQRRRDRFLASRSRSAAVGACTTSTPSGARHGEVGREQRHLRPAAAGLGGERDAHPARGAVAEEAHGVERLTRPACTDEHLRCPRATAAFRRAAPRSGERSPPARSSGPAPTSPSASSPDSGPISSHPARA